MQTKSTYKQSGVYNIVQHRFYKTEKFTWKLCQVNATPVITAGHVETFLQKIER